jgi:hypothetical protein
MQCVNRVEIVLTTVACLSVWSFYSVFWKQTTQAPMSMDNSTELGMHSLPELEPEWQLLQGVHDYSQVQISTTVLIVLLALKLRNHQ